MPNLGPLTPHPPPLVPSEARLSAAFIAALEITHPNPVGIPPSEWTLALINHMTYGRNALLPPWCSAPGSPEGLAGIQAIGIALGYSLKSGKRHEEAYRLITKCGTHLELWDHGWYLETTDGDGEDDIVRDCMWSEADALPRLLHLLLALAPTTGGGR